MSPKPTRNPEVATTPCSPICFHQDHGPPYVRPSADLATSLRPPNAALRNRAEKPVKYRLPPRRTWGIILQGRELGTFTDVAWRREPCLRPKQALP
jgi:hypothetical protein